MRRRVTSHSNTAPGSLSAVTTLDTIRIPVVQLSQKEVPLYSGKMTARDLLATFDIKKFNPRESEMRDWYQRQRYESKIRDMQKFVEECPIPIVPGILLGVRGVKFDAEKGGLGHVTIPRTRGAVTVIDGQHRLGGFDKIKEDIDDLVSQQTLGSLSKDQQKRLTRLQDLLDFEIPVVIMDSERASVAAKAEAEGFRADALTPDAAERVVFFILNKTQKGLNPSHKDQLMYRIWYSGVRGIPVIEREKWRAHATKLVESLRGSDPMNGHIIDSTAG